MFRSVRHLASAVLVVLLLACGACGARIPEDAQRVTVSLDRIDCSECGDRIVADLRGRPGVYEASFDRRAAEVRVTASPSFDVFTTVKNLSAAEGFQAILGAGKGRYLPFASFPEGADAKIVAHDGEDVADLASVTVKGKVTVVDFSATWCKPCRLVDDHMAKVLSKRGDVAYRKLDIKDWDSPLAKHYLRDVPKLPYVIVFGAGGQKVKSFSGVDIEGIDAAIAQGKTP